MRPAPVATLVVIAAFAGCAHVASSNDLIAPDCTLGQPAEHCGLLSDSLADPTAVADRFHRVCGEPLTMALDRCLALLGEVPSSFPFRYNFADLASVEADCKAGSCKSLRDVEVRLLASHNQNVNRQLAEQRASRELDRDNGRPRVASAPAPVRPSTPEGLASELDQCQQRAVDKFNQCQEAAQPNAAARMAAGMNNTLDTLRAIREQNLNTCRFNYTGENQRCADRFNAGLIVLRSRAPTPEAPQTAQVSPGSENAEAPRPTPAAPPPAPAERSGGLSCSVEQVLKMKQAGLSDEQVRKACQ